MRAIEKYDDKFSKQQEKTDGAVFDYQREMDNNGGLIHCAPPTPRKYNFHVGLVKLLSGVRYANETPQKPLANAIDSHAPEDVRNDGTETEILLKNFPSLTEPSHRWALNREIPTSKIKNYCNMKHPRHHGADQAKLIKCFKDFPRKWYSVSSTVICVSSSVATILIVRSTLPSSSVFRTILQTIILNTSRLGRRWELCWLTNSA
ncbi:Uncharacterized protein APZ42_018162 [Daphnia magna]|uniref:Uncharacterized protein n=1 Tax=Daphnia magna TaxID=35525 RepID=A0A164ZB56_9CRUS|nr:Uncharacterized protein APZ42_018162 [Daphnia magna]